MSESKSESESEGESESEMRARARSGDESVFRRIKLIASSCFRPLAKKCRERDGLNGPDLVW